MDLDAAVLYRLVFVLADQLREDDSQNIPAAGGRTRPLAAPSRRSSPRFFAGWTSLTRPSVRRARMGRE